MARMGSFIFDGSDVSENVYMWLSVQVTGRRTRKIKVLRFGQRVRPNQRVSATVASSTGLTHCLMSFWDESGV
jgi:hypothetical protein